MSHPYVIVKVVSNKKAKSIVPTSTTKSTQLPPIKNKATKTNYGTFTKNSMREIYNHEGWKKKPFNDCLYQLPHYKWNSTKLYAPKGKQLTYGCTVDRLDYECLIDNGKWCNLFDEVSEMVGSKTITQHSQDELMLSYFTGEVLHVFNPDNWVSYHYILGQFLSRYNRSSVREEAEKLATSNLNKESYSTTDLRYNKGYRINQFQLLRRFICEVV